MADYIDREEYCEKHCRCSNEYCDKESCPIWKAPAADVEPVRRWIPVSEQLPEFIPCSAGSAYSEAVNIWTTGKKVMVGVWDGIDWIAPFDCWEAWGDEVTHWMPLPKPPKMDEGAENG